MALFVFNRVTKAYSDRLWLVVVYDYMHKITDEDAKKVNSEIYEYKFFEKQKIFSEAEALCKEWGKGHLASITNAKEYEKIKSLSNDDQFWIGAKQKRQEGEWTHSDGSSTEFLETLWANPG
jgi:hypothetical protein